MLDLERTIIRHRKLMIVGSVIEAVLLCLMVVLIGLLVVG